MPSLLCAAFLVVAPEAYGRQIPFAFLERVRDEWQQKWTEKGPAATAHSLDKSFGPRLKHWMEWCEQHPEELSKVASVQKKVRQEAVQQAPGVELLQQPGGGAAGRRVV